jgi:DNA repair exonuclease SbcCD ATPase subunit
MMFVLVLCVAGAVANQVTPIEKVVTMLSDIQLQIITEGKAEAITYDKFACFCKDMTAEKTEAVTEGEDYVDEYTAAIGQLTADRDEADDQINELTSKISKLDKALTLEKERRHKEFTEFSALEAEISMGVRILTNTIADMKAAGGSAALLKMKSHTKTIRKVLAMAEAMGHVTPKYFREVNSFLEQAQAPEVPEGDNYSFHSQDIISTLDSFLQEFKTKLSELKIEDTKASADHDFVIQSKGAEKYALEKDMRRAKKLHAQKMKEVATASADLTWAQSTLTDDQAFLQEVSSRCNAKAKEWDTRSTVRKDELTAITSALSIIKTKVAKPSAALNAVSSKTMRLPAPEEIDEEEADADHEEEEADDSLAFVQVAQSPRKHINVLAARMANQGAEESLEPYKQALILSILKQKSQELHSKDLAMLAGKIQGDPFAKIRKLIQEMIEKLLQEAADEATHKGWCDKEISKSTESRDAKAAMVRQLNEELAENEAKRDVIEEEMTKLSEAISKLEDALAVATKERADESAENAAVVKEAQEGKEAIEEAITVLDDFYKTQKASASFVQAKQPIDMPDAGFEGEYTGVGGGTGGVMGMMDVIKSDFEREISETEAAEKAANKEFFEFQGTTKTSIATKTVTKTAHETELTEVNSALAEDKASMEEVQELMDKAIQSLLELQPACVGEKMTYAERVAMREQEIESLKTTLCVLDKQGPVQTEAECANSDASALGL